VSRVSHSTMAAALKMGGAILAASLDAAPAGPPIIARAAPVSPNARPIIMRAIDWRLREPRFGIPRKEGMALFGHELTRQLAIETAGELQTFLDGGRRLITADSIAIRMIALALLSHPVDGPALKVRLPPGRYQKRRREPTPAELEGLKRGNERRREEAQKRRAAADNSRPRSKRADGVPA
jgi:hypothetical protein